MRARRPRRALVGRRQASLWWATLAALALLVAACGTADPQDAMTPKGPVAESQDALWGMVFPIAVAVFILVQGLLLVALIRFRARRDDDDRTLPKQVAGNTRLEVAWTIIPALILVAIAVPTVRTIFDLAQKPADPLEVRVVGKQYWWEFEYTGEEGKGVVTANELVVPADRDVYLTMVATGQQTFAGGAPPAEGEEPQFDWTGGVIHSFWVPSLAGKQDVVPGHERTMTINASEPGSYSGQCAEFCGLSHANMRFSVEAKTADEFSTWIDEQTQGPSPPSSGLAAQGAQLFSGGLEGNAQQCIACHGITGVEGAEARQGPDLTNFAERAKFAGYILDNNDENLRAWLADPQASKPGAQMPNLQLTDDEIDALVAYLRTLDPGASE
ncbi:MAG: cytochrome c oxidase subunit II [Egibacteraceae bacterium]